jgi:hypothetical protein
MGASLAAVCREGHEAPSDNSVRETLNEQGWDERRIETACNDLLAKALDSALGKVVSRWPWTCTRSPFMANCPRMTRR